MQEIINKLGLEKTEAAVYTALLELGPSSVTEITKKAGVTRTLGYHVLEKLGWEGLVDESSGKNKKKIYVAQHPQQLVRYLNRKEKSWQKKVTQAKELLPDLVSLYKIGDKPTVRYQEGTRGVISLFEESLESKSEIISVLDVESWKTSEFWDWAKNYNRERNKKKIKERILILDTLAGRDWVKNYKGSRTFTVYKWIKPNDAIKLLQFGGELNVYDNKVMIAILEESKKMGIIIESAILANIIKAMYELVWDNAESVRFSRKK
ncbi:hypothetical protein HOF40_04895 [Candidatus Parcubacteria bacterium]|nr:hypothetical protein [Candidatus Parcubacteria bacterium]MBT3949393.1 hypothetical protein [Candidatus Parcubacteria bacterium]